MNGGLCCRRNGSIRGKVATKARARSGKGAAPTIYQQCHAVAHNSIALVRLISDASVVGERDPSPPADLLQPDFICGIVRVFLWLRLMRTSYPNSSLRAHTVKRLRSGALLHRPRPLVRRPIAFVPVLYQPR